MHPNTPQVVPGQVEVDRSTVEPKTYYSNLDGACYYFKDGKTARFEGASYTTAFKGEQDELDDLVGTPEVKEVKDSSGKVVKVGKPARPGQPGNHQFSYKELPVQRSDALVMKDVSKSSGTGVLSTANLRGLV